MKLPYSLMSEADCFAVTDEEGNITYYRQVPNYGGDKTIFDNGYLTRTPIDEEQLRTKKHIVFVGDSFTYGHGVSYADTISALYNEELNNDDYYVVNIGMPGSSGDWAVARLQQWMNTFGDQVHIVIFGMSFANRRCHWELSKYTTMNETEPTTDEIYNHVHTNVKEFPVVAGFDENVHDSKERNRYFRTLSNSYLYQQNPLMNAVNLEKNLQMLSFISKIYDCDIHWWGFMSQTFSPSDLFVLLNHYNDERFKYFEHPTFPLGKESSYMLPDQHWNRNGNALFVEKLKEIIKI